MTLAQLRSDLRRPRLDRPTPAAPVDLARLASLARLVGVPAYRWDPARAEFARLA